MTRVAESIYIPTISFESFDEHDDDAIALLGEQVSDALTTSGFMKVTNLGISRFEIDPLQTALPFSRQVQLRKTDQPIKVQRKILVIKAWDLSTWTRGSPRT